jgi:hypothetical protein
MVWLARAQGAYYAASGVWALVHRRSFEAALGPKIDYWLVQTVAGLLVSIGVVQLRAGDSRAELAAARRLGIGSAATLLAVELRHVSTGRLWKTYLLDAAVEAGLVAGWLAGSGAGNSDVSRGS